ncbi:MAG TPA: hypothetical protein ENH00_10910 [Actinobacteria bacterium]|nr:hypothetical protein [Actinomycetota bacterium]HDL49258.1 hypothetical protein [Actinomycetota bacterium]
METGEEASGEDRTESLRDAVPASRLHVLRTALGGALQDPVIVILILAGIFDGLSGSPVHAILLIGVGLLLARTSTEGPAIQGPGSQVGDVGGRDGRYVGVRKALAEPAHVSERNAVGLVVVVLYAAIVGGFERYSWPATLAVVVPGLLGLVLVWRESVVPGPEPAPISRRGARAWGTVFVALGLWELTNLLLQPSLEVGSHAHPTLSVLMDPILSLHVGRSISLFLWLAFGWYLVRR